MSTKHTPGPLQISEPEGPFDTWLILCEAPHEVAHIAPRFKNGERDKAQEEANASRLVACWNACEGIDDELLADDCIRKTREDRDELLKQRDELLEALKAAVLQNRLDMLMTGDEIRKCESAIAKATGAPK